MEGKTNRLWAEAMNYACDMSNRCVATFIDQVIFPYELRNRRPTMFGSPYLSALLRYFTIPMSRTPP